MHDLTEDERRYEKYIDVAMELLTMNGEVSPSARALVERVGGSMTTANKAMRVFWGYVGRRLSYDQQYPDGMPIELIKLMERVVAIARNTAKKELETERLRFEESAEELEARNAILKRSVESLSEEMNHKKLYNDDLQRELDSLKQRLAAAKSEGRELEIANTALSSQVSMFEKELMELNSRLRVLGDECRVFQSELKAKQEKIGTIELDNQTLRERVANLTKKESEYKEELDRSCVKLASLEERNLTTQEKLGERNAELAKAEVEIAESRRFSSKLEVDLERSVKRISFLENQISSLDSELAGLRPLKVSFETVAGQVADLRGERDRLLMLMDEIQPIRSAHKKNSEAD